LFSTTLPQGDGGGAGGAGIRRGVPPAALYPGGRAGVPRPHRQGERVPTYEYPSSRPIKYKHSPFSTNHRLPLGLGFHLPITNKHSPPSIHHVHALTSIHQSPIRNPPLAQSRTSTHLHPLITARHAKHSHSPPSTNHRPPRPHTHFHPPITARRITQVDYAAREPEMGLAAAAAVTDKTVAPATLAGGSLRTSTRLTLNLLFLLARLCEHLP